LLRARGAEVEYYDPYIPVITPTREHANWTGKKSVGWDKKTVASFDAVLISTAHDSVNYAELSEWSSCIIDTRNAMAKVKHQAGQVWPA
ncbi:MAG: UDP binding domain-containing protein, partial [Verrucomicrobiales bacterium]